MAKQKKTGQTSRAAAQPLRPIDIYFNLYNQTHQHPANRLISVVATPLTTFCMVGVFWWLPFPHIAFLGVYNADVNWASFIIAFSVYFYYRLSPILSYMMLLMLFAFSFLITQMGLSLNNGHFKLWMLYLAGFIFISMVKILGYRFEKDKPASLYQAMVFLLIAPVYWLSVIFKKYTLRF